MILAAIRAKLRARGAIGFAADASELAFGCFVGGVYQFAVAGGAVAGVVVSLPLLAFEILAKPRAGERPHRCDTDCASDCVPCGRGPYRP